MNRTLKAPFICCLLLLCPLLLFGREIAASDSTMHTVGRKIKIKTVVPKGQWIGGLNASYTSLTANNFSFLILDEATVSGYQLKVQPFVLYTIKNNLATGFKFSYDRSLFRLDNVDIQLGDSDVGLQDLYKLEHNYTATGVIRQYVNMGDIKRFACFMDLQLALSGGQAKILNGKMEALSGTYQQIFSLGVGVTPGIVAFISRYSAVELSVGLLGFKFSSVHQLHNRIGTSSRSTASGNFRIDIFSIGLGMAFYL